MPGFKESSTQRLRRQWLQQRVGTTVRQLRERRGLSQAALAQRVQAISEDPTGATRMGSQAGIARVEAGHRQLTVDGIEVLARALEVHPVALVLSAYEDSIGGGTNVDLFAPFLRDDASAQALASLVTLANGADRAIIESVGTLLNAWVKQHVPGVASAEVQAVIAKLWGTEDTRADPLPAMRSEADHGRAGTVIEALMAKELGVGVPVIRTAAGMRWQGRELVDEFEQRLRARGSSQVMEIYEELAGELRDGVGGPLWQRHRQREQQRP